MIFMSRMCFSSILVLLIQCRSYLLFYISVQHHSIYIREQWADIPFLCRQQAYSPRGIRNLHTALQFFRRQF